MFNSDVQVGNKGENIIYNYLVKSDVDNKINKISSTKFIINYIITRIIFCQ